MAGALSLRIRHLRLRAETARGRFGADFAFSDGLVVLRADNSRGKSTAVKSILFALGLERMVTARSTDVLTSAMRENLIYDMDTKAETPVIGSWVALEIQNEPGSIATVTRWVKDEQRESGLVQVQEGPALTSPGSHPSQDYFVGRAGSVANPRGFHRWLADFIGWDMPHLPARDGKLAPLYMEQVFPLLFVEQRRGWGGIQAQMPAFSGVSDVRRKAVEFLLNLEVGGLEVERQRLLARRAELQSDWTGLVRGFRDAIAGQGVVTTGLSESLSTVWPLPEQPSVVQSVDDEWIPIDQVLANLRAEQARHDAAGTESGNPDEASSESRLSSLMEEADSLRQSEAILRANIIRDRGELRALEDRLVALREDLREHQDLVTLQKLGSHELEVLHDDCPVCHQQLPASLLEGQTGVRTLSPEDTVAYIRNQIDLFETMRTDSEHARGAKIERLASFRDRAAAIRSEIRALRTDLTSPENAPSAEEIARRLRTQDRIERLESVDERFLQLLGDLGDLAEAGKEIAAALKALPGDQLSAQDKSKLSALEQSFLSQLQDYDFSSFSDEKLTISRDDYRPRREDWDLQADISASDSIRVVWAYLLGLLEVGKRFSTNHPGFLAFDEPRQQSTKKVSFAALLRRAAGDSKDSQVIFATSEELASLREMLAGISHELHAVDGFLLKPVSE